MKRLSLKTYSIFSTLLLSSLCLFADDTLQSVRDSLAIRAPELAVRIAADALKANPDNVILKKHYIIALAQSGQPQKMIEEWDTFQQAQKSEAFQDDLLEEMAWGVLNHGTKSTSPLERLAALLGGFFSSDMRGVRVVLDQMKGQSHILRGIAVDLSTELQDQVLKDQIELMWKNEKNQEVRAKVIQAMGALKMNQYRGDLETLLLKGESCDSEAALLALIAMEEDLTHGQFNFLLTHPASRFRLLGLMLWENQEESLPFSLLVPLLSDPQSTVRMQALKVGTLFSTHAEDLSLWKEQAKPLLKDPDPFVQVIAAWSLSALGENVDWLPFFKHQDTRVRLTAASCLHTLENKIPLTTELVRLVDERFLKLNLGFGLLKWNRASQEMMLFFTQTLSSSHSLWMWDEVCGFPFITESRLSFVKGEDDPLLQHHLCRLELLSILALKNSHPIQNSIKELLRDRRLKISLMASSVALMQGDDEPVQDVKSLIDDEALPATVRIQAALLIAVWSKDPAAIQKVIALYPETNRKVKEEVLQALSVIGTREAVPFLVEEMKSPFSTMRILAAFSLIRCLNS